MKVLMTKKDFSYACDELRTAFVKAMPLIKEMLNKYEELEDDRTLVIVLLCPCCSHDDILETKNSILVSPLAGIDNDEYTIHKAQLFPPFREPERDEEANTIEIFVKHFEKVIDQALVQSQI